jgi:hypothetical protein
MTSAFKVEFDPPGDAAAALLYWADRAAEAPTAVRRDFCLWVSATGRRPAETGWRRVGEKAGTCAVNWWPASVAVCRRPGGDPAVLPKAFGLRVREVFYVHDTTVAAWGWAYRGWVSTSNAFRRGLIKEVFVPPLKFYWDHNGETVTGVMTDNLKAAAAMLRTTVGSIKAYGGFALATDYPEEMRVRGSVWTKSLRDYAAIWSRKEQG